MGTFAFEEKLDHMLFAPSQKVWVAYVNTQWFQEGIRLR